MRLLVEQLQQVVERPRDGGGKAKIEKQHRAGKLTASGRIAALVDPGALFLGFGPRSADDRG